MKKLYTLIAALVCAVCVNAATEDEIALSADWGWGWGKEDKKPTASMDNGILVITYNTDGGYSTGWNTPEDWSKYRSLSVVIESYDGDWGKIFFQNDNGNLSNEFSKIESQQTITINIDATKDTWVSQVKQFAIQAKAGTTLKISRIYLTEALEYETTGKNISFDEWGNINASEFEGYSDNAKVVFKYNITGELVNDENQSVVGWGIGSIKSIDGKVEVANVSIKALGDNELTLTLSQIKEALASGPDDYNRYGLYWNMWPVGKSTPTRKSVVIYEVKSNDPTAISNTIAPAKAENNVRYNLLGVKNGNGIYIMNGKKFLK